MKNLFLASLFFSLFFVGCSSSEPKEEPVVVEKAVVVEPVEMGKEIMPKPTLDK